MASGAVTIEIEYHDDNSFHTTYQVSKYPEYARKLEENLRDKLACEGIDPIIKKNPGPGKGYTSFWNCRHWYSSTKDGGQKVRYPRLGSFEVAVKCPSGFAHASTGLPKEFEVWSKLSSRRWPDVEKLAQALARLLAAGRADEDVSDQVRRMKARCDPKLLGDTGSKPPRIAPPMSFGLAPREGTQSSIGRATPKLDGAQPRCAPSPALLRPASACEASRIPAGGDITVTPATLRPNSASQPRMGSGLNQTNLLAPADAQVSPTGHLEKDLSAIPVHDDDGFDEDDPTLPEPDRTQQDELEPTASEPQQPTPPARPHLQELTRRLVAKHGSSADPAHILKCGQRVLDTTTMLDADSFKNKLYLLRVFGEPFNFNALFEEICFSEPDGPWTSLGILLEAMQDEWPAPSTNPSPRWQESVEEPPAPPPPPPAAASVPAAAASAAPAAVPDYDDYGEDDFEEDIQEQGTPGEDPAGIPDEDDSREAIQQDETHSQDAPKVSEEDDMAEDEMDYQSEFENDSQPDDSPKKADPPAFAPGPAAPVVHAKPSAPAPTSPAAPAARPDDGDGDDYAFESDGEYSEPEEQEPDDDDANAHGSEQVQDDDDVDRGEISDEEEFEDDDSVKSASD